MNNTHTPASDNHPTPTGKSSSTTSRQPKGTGLPASVWLSPATEPLHDNARRPSAQKILPDWAVDRLAEEYLPAGYSVIHAEYREHIHSDPNPGETRIGGLPDYSRSGKGPAALAIVEYQPQESDPRAVTEWRTPGWHRVHNPRGTDQELAKLLKAAHNSLSGRGVLAIAVARPTNGQAFTDHTSYVIRTARTAGFGYLQHLAVITTAATGDKFAADAETGNTGHVTPLNKRGRVHGRIHHDVLIFTA